MTGFLVTAQYGMDDIPLRLHTTKTGALVYVDALRSMSPESLHDLAQKTMGVMTRDASIQIEGAEISLTGFDTNGLVFEHEVFGLRSREKQPQ